ncbi:MAG TPA: hypothetical protein VGV59_13835 [Pyrinomonadaceae bacterium]|nr:hypothetical protein [Pyrinomonadaceae bacterium]
MSSTFAATNVSDDSVLLTTLLVLIGLVALVGQKAGAQDVELNPQAGYQRPMLALELHAGEAPQIFKSWDRATKDRLRTAVLWDYLFIFIYPAAFAAGCFIAARFLDSRGIMPFKYGLIIIFLQLLAAVLDSVENYALLQVLGETIRSPWPQVARWSAIAKFVLIAVGAIYALLIGGGTWLFLLVRNLFVGKAV